MPHSSRKLVTGVLLLIAMGALIGWIYGRPFIGALAAALLVLAWQLRQLVAFDRALQTGEFDRFRYGEGIWQRIYSRFRYERERGNRYKRDYRRLIMEIRRSTDAMPDGAVILNEGNEIVTCNRAAKSLAGLKRRKDRGQRIDNILRDPRLTDLLEADDATQTADIPSPVRDGYWLSCRIVPYGADQKLFLLSDVTERIALSKMRRDFVANASHELRSPLTVLSGYLDTISDDDRLPSDWMQPIRQMQEQARRMNRIVAELLELSRLEAAGRADTGDVVDIAALLAGGRKAFHGQAGAPSIRIEAESMARLRGNSSEIESVISNLLSNAVRHTPADGEVVLSWRSGPGGGDLTVSDTGEGIAEVHLPRLTERFFRVDRGRARADGGVGLGLAIVKHVLGRHDATLHISSNVGVGSEFRCHFPTERLLIGPPVPLTGGSHSR